MMYSDKNSDLNIVHMLRTLTLILKQAKLPHVGHVYFMSANLTLRATGAFGVAFLFIRFPFSFSPAILFLSSLRSY